MRYYSPNLIVMPNRAYMLLWVLLPFWGHSQNAIHGKVVDELGLPIYRAAIALDNSEDVVYSDLEGTFNLESDKAFHWKITISSTGYKSESFFVLSGGRTEDLVLEYDEALKKMLENSP